MKGKWDGLASMACFKLIAPAVSSRGGAGGKACEGVLPGLKNVSLLLEGDVGRDGRAEVARVAPRKAGGEVREGVIWSVAGHLA